MEGAMLSNPKHIFYKYHPFDQELIEEEYDFDRMISNRQNQINKVKPSNNIQVGIIRGLLGRQGNPKIVERIELAL